ncbi:hypothetical protein [Xenorhabdus sp. IM139775]|nr:hypothetical protein [Xenorhabdus sp. IM139775]MDC9594420.1 hypothetical protein [Xenorhabdus sp. IM139775]
MTSEWKNVLDRHYSDPLSRINGYRTLLSMTEAGRGFEPAIKRYQ